MLADKPAESSECVGRELTLAELPWTALPALRLDRADQRLLRIGEFDLRFGQCGRECSD